MHKHSPTSAVMSAVSFNALIIVALIPLALRGIAMRETIPDSILDRAPDGDGIDLTRQLREWSRVPIIVISARGREDDKVSALDAGADDYLTKPFGVNELLARMRVALRRAHSSGAQDAEPVLQFGELRIDLVR